MNRSDSDLCMAISNEGGMLLLPLSSLPVLGKGNKIISNPSARVKVREEFVTLLAVVPAGPETFGSRVLPWRARPLRCQAGGRG